MGSTPARSPRHGILTPTYRVDRLERYLAWYEKYLKPSETSEARR